MEKVGKVKGRVTDEHTAPNLVADELTYLKVSVFLSVQLTANFTEYNKLLESTGEEAASTKEEVTRAGPEKQECSKVITEACEKSEPRPLRLNAALDDRSWSWKWTHSSMT